MTEDYFPSTAQLLKYITFKPSDLGGYRPTKEQDGCQLCGGTGWKNSKLPVDKNRSVVRCECRRRA